MTVLTGLNTFSAGTPAVASQVNTNFATIKTYVDGLSAGTNIDNGTIGIAKLSAAATGILSPVGSVVQYVGANEPTNWKRCDGQALLIASYPDLYALLTTGGTVFPWGANPSGTTFLLPNFGGRVPVGKNADAEFDVLGETGGAKTVTLTEAQLASHNHTQNPHNHTQDPHLHTIDNHDHTINEAGNHAHGTTTTSNAGSHAHTANATSSGGSTSHLHDNMYDYLAAGVNGYPLGSGINALSNAGSHEHTVTVGSAGTHGHTTPNRVVTMQTATATNIASTATNIAAGSGAAHNNLQPYIVVNYIIKVL
jgi:microcystin-dependent protein